MRVNEGSLVCLICIHSRTKNRITPPLTKSTCLLSPFILLNNLQIYLVNIIHKSWYNNLKSSMETFKYSDKHLFLLFV